VLLKSIPVDRHIYNLYEDLRVAMLMFQKDNYVFSFGLSSQEAGAPHPEYIDRKKENAFFTHL